MASDFAGRLLAWHAKSGRHDLPWQQPRSAYRVWLSEIMLQQTQVTTVIPYFLRFLERFPDISSLAAAEQDDVMSAWAGLGYYSRARNLHKAAQQVVSQHAGQFPQTYDDVLALPGVGPSTAGAILAQAFGQRHAILDGNVKRVLSRHEAIAGWPGQSSVEKLLWAAAERYTPDEQLPDYTQAIMDLGASVCKRSRPQCGICPLSTDCKALAADRVDHYPAPRPKRNRPLRSVRMLLLEREGDEILLVKRPPTGIWGGLWSLPEVPESVSAEEYCAEQLGVKVQGIKEVTGLRHGFTHFELDIQPFRAIASDASIVMDDAASLWYKVGPQASAERPGMPAPISRLLQQEFG